MRPSLEPTSVDTASLLSHIVLQHYFVVEELEPIANLIKKVVRHPPENQERRFATQLLHYCAKHYTTDFAHKLSGIFVATQHAYDIREGAISILHRLLIRVDEQGAQIIASKDMDGIGETLVSWLDTENFPERGFKILSKVVSRFASHAFSQYPARNWNELGCFMSNLMRFNFRNGVQIFRDLPFPLSAYFLIPVLEDIYPRISEALDLQAGDENWVLAFGAGFVLAVQEIHCGHAIFVENILYYSVKSVIQLVSNRKVGLVRRGLLDVEEFSKENAEKFNKNAYDYASELIRTINGLACAGEEIKEITRRIMEVLEEKCRKKVRVHFIIFDLRRFRAKRARNM